MEITKNHTHNALETTGAHAADRKVREIVKNAARFTKHFLEMLVAMAAGMGVFHLVLGLFPRTSSVGAALASGTVVHTIVMNTFMTVPMVLWMVLRGHGWRHGLEMAAAMLVPMAAVTLLCQLGLAAYLPWLAEASAPAMFLGMLAAMLYRRSHYTGQKHPERTAGPKSLGVTFVE